MTTEEIIAGNRLIAEFMGALAEQWYPANKENNQSGVRFSFPKENYPANEKYVSDTALQYHSSWDWLIPVCYKWDNLNIDKKEYELLSDNLDDAVTLYEIEAVYQQLVNNIRWYNLYLSGQQKS